MSKKKITGHKLQARSCVRILIPYEQKKRIAIVLSHISYHLRVSSSNPDKSRSKYVIYLAFFQECKGRKAMAKLEIGNKDP